MSCFSSAFIARKRRLARIVALAVVALAAGALPQRVLAQQNLTWAGGNMTWTQPDSDSWSGGNGTYVSGDNVTFTSTGAGTVTISGTVNPANFTITSGTTYAFTGGGSTLSANGTTFQVGPASGGTVNVTANMSGLSHLVYNNSGGTFRVGKVSTDSTISTNTLTLAANNTITADNLFVADNGGQTGSTGSQGFLHLGSTNVINVNNINVGYSGRSDATLNFAAGSSSATFRGVDGSSPVGTWQVGRLGNNNAKTWNDIVNFSNGTIDAIVTSLTVGTADSTNLTGRRGNVAATFTMGAGNMTVTNLQLGQIFGLGNSTINTSFSATATFTLNNAAGVLDAGTITLATNTILATGGAMSVSGTFNLTNGTLKATTIQRGTQGGNAAVTTAFNWTNGTLQNTDGADLAISNVPINLIAGNHTFHATGTNSITVASTSNMTGSGQGFTKTGAGILILDGSKAYSGDTFIDDGTLYVTGALSSSAVTVEADGIIGSNGANGTLGNGLTIAAGGALDLTGATLAADSSGILSITGGSLTLGNLTFQDLVGWDWLNAAEGTYELIDGAFSVDFGSTAFTSPETAYDFGNGKQGYFTSGSLNAVIIPVPEPSTLALLAAVGGLAGIAAARRSR
jgi:autotransporter-associated beta strand protein